MDACDVLIIGAGPAGVSAALRLRQLGYQVMLIERSATWPRKQVGEALTAGVQNIIATLDANDALAHVPHLAGLPSCLLWRGRAPEMVPDSGSAMVDRAAFDATLLALAQSRGVQLERPAQVVKIAGTAGDWRIDVRCGEACTKHIATRFVIEAGGRSGQGRGKRLECAPRLAAMWTEFPQAGLAPDLLRATRTEALEDGWLWGASLPGLQYRLMLVFDPAAAHPARRCTPAERLRAACTASALFAGLNAQAFDGALDMCSATPYLIADSRQDGRIKIGDAAFALDPISSSGVEKAMRFSLQAAVAVHTLLSERAADSASLSRDFFEHRLVETCARHAHWTASSYRQAWCANRLFWRRRSCPQFLTLRSGARSELVDRLYRAIAQLEAFQAPELRPLASMDRTRSIRLNSHASLIQLPCVIANRVHMRAALDHPNLERPLAFVENHALFPHLQQLQQAQTIEMALRQLSFGMPERIAGKIIGWLWQRGVLDNVS